MPDRGKIASSSTEWGWATVMVVDDDETSLRLLQAMVGRFGVGRIIPAVDGVDCLDKIMESNPDLIISDVAMPRMDGIELCRHIRQMDELADIPILIATGSIGIDRHLECFNAGASDVLTKPLRSSELRARMRVHLENRQLVHNLRKEERRITRELEGARRMQLGLMPKPHRLLDVSAKYGVAIEGIVTPSSSIGGDFWGVIDINDHAIGVYTVDFSGHGVMSALNTFRFHAMIGEMSANRKDPASFLAVLNETLAGVLPSGQYATFFYAVIDTLRETLTWSGAGAPFPLLLREGKFVYLDTTGTPLGLDINSVYFDSVLPFPVGSGLFAYSDGMADARAKTGGEIGDVRDLFPAPGTPTLDIGLAGILAKFHHLAEEPLADDLTAVWVRNDGSGWRQLALRKNDDGALIASGDETDDDVGKQTNVLLMEVRNRHSVENALRRSNAVVEIGNGDFNLPLDLIDSFRTDAILLSMTTKSAYRFPPCVTLCNAIAEKGWLLTTQYDDVLLAVQEALSNAVMHGNLELESPRGGGEIIRQYWRELRTRLEMPRLIHRRITLLATMTGTTLSVSIEDQGKGFQRPEQGADNGHKSCGRGGALMTCLATTVQWEKRGRRVVLTFAL